MRPGSREFADYLKKNYTSYEKDHGSKVYRLAAYLKDGTYIPCVEFKSEYKYIIHSIDRLKDIGNEEYHTQYSTVSAFVASGNRVNDYDIEKVEKSRYAVPQNILNQIKGETKMGWTGFSAKMKDGKYLAFGTSFNFEFFNIPEPYTFDEVEEIINHSYVTREGELKYHELYTSKYPTDYVHSLINREKTFFSCYLGYL